VDEDGGGGCGDGITAVERDDPAFFEGVFGEDRPAGAAVAVLLFQTSRLLLVADDYGARVGPTG
jgi:hypothetical protein